MLRSIQAKAANGDYSVSPKINNAPIPAAQLGLITAEIAFLPWKKGAKVSFKWQLAPNNRSPSYKIRGACRNSLKTRSKSFNNFINRFF